MPEGGPRAVLLTRPLEDGRRIADRLAEDGIPTLLWPLTRVVPAGDALSGLRLPPGTDALIATSGHGIRAFAALSGRRDLAVIAVGARTGEIARELGFGAVLIAEGDAEALARLVRATPYRRLFYPRGRDVASDLAGRLSGPERAVTEAVLYAAEETGPPSAPVAHALARGQVGIVTAWSRRGAEILARRLEGQRHAARMAGLAISREAAAPLAGLGLGAVIAAESPDARGMLAAIRAASPWLAPL